MSSFDQNKDEEKPPVPPPVPEPVVRPRPQPLARPSALAAAASTDPAVAAARGDVSAPFADAPDLDPALVERMKAREAYIAQMRAGDIARSDFDPAQLAGEGAKDVVRLRGTDSTPAAGKGGEGHIMGTQMIAQEGAAPAVGEHFSFYPAHFDVRAARDAAGSPKGSEMPRIGAGQPPFETSGPISVGSMPGGLAPEESDHYLYQTQRKADGSGMERIPDTPEKKQDFDHAFDPSFLDPEKFAKAVAARKAREAELAAKGSGPNLQAMDAELDEGTGGQYPESLIKDAARKQLSEENEFRLASVPVDREMTGDDFKPTSMGRLPERQDEMGTVTREGFSESDPRVRQFQPPEGGAAEPTVQAQNCGTELMKTFVGMGLLGPEDMLMLGADKNGRFKPGFDLTPQQLYEHMRWREHEFLEDKKRKAKQAAEAAAAAGPEAA